MKLRQLPAILGLISTSIFFSARADDSTAAMTATNTVTVTNMAPAAPTNAVMSLPPATTPVAVIPPGPVEPVIATAPRPEPAFRPLMIGAEIGTTGGGVVGRWQFTDHLGVGAAVDYLSIHYNGKIQGNDYRTHLRLLSVPITLDGYPLNNNYLRLSAGIVINHNHFEGTSTGTIDLNGASYVGTARLDIRQQPVDPYIAVGGNVYFTKDHRFSMGGELGLLFTGEPRVHLTLNPPSGAVEAQRRQQESEIRHYARYAEVWPVLKLSINYSF